MRAGFSLAETMMALGLLSLIMVVCALLGRPLGIISSRTLARWEMQQQALIALGAVRSQLLRSGPLGISAHSEILAINPYEQPICDNSGNVRWARQIVVYFRYQSELRERHWPPVGAGDPSPPAFFQSVALAKKLDPPLLLPLAHGQAAHRRLATGVTGFEIQGILPNGALQQPLKLCLDSFSKVLS